MGFFDRIFGKKKTSTSTTTNTATTTPNNPVWVTQGLEGVGGALTGLLSRDPKSFVSGPSALQTQAFNDAGNLGLSSLYGNAGRVFKRVAGRGANTYQAAQGKATGYTASSLLEGLDRYKSPYEQDVVNTALADFDYGAGATRAQQALDEARSGAFGGSGAAITRALTEGDLARGRASTSANLRDQMFTRATGLSATDAGFRNQAAADRAAAENQFGLANMTAMNDAGRFNASAADTALARQLAAGGALQGLGTTMGAEQRANLTLQGQLGADQRAIEQAQTAAPLTVLQQLASTYGGLPLNLLSGSTVTGSGTAQGVTKEFDPWGTITNLINAGANVISARR
ncbi:MAG: hypothetical protein INF04_04145 [Phenylobacterium sp.]|jgi:hypothetical protein|nr:hypothetical protein [Phenylobacterium sp.]MCA6238299.1 hypothetical protein [Phenylobacterium sp.]